MIKLKEITKKFIDDFDSHVKYLTKRFKEINQLDRVKELKHINKNREPYSTLLKYLNYFYTNDSEPIKKAFFSQILMAVILEDLYPELFTKYNRNIKQYLKFTQNPEKDFETFNDKMNIIRNNIFYYDTIPEIRKILHPTTLLGPDYIRR